MLLLIAIILTIIASNVTQGLPYCDIKSLDSVFSVGHLIYFIRCGEVWTFDDRIDGGQGAFLRDYSMLAYARHWFGENVAKTDGKYSDEKLLFNGFSFQGISCLTHADDFNKTCFRSTQAWDRLTIMFDRTHAVPFYYRYIIETDDELVNPLGFKKRQDLREKHGFLPRVDRFFGIGSDPTKREIVSALYDNLLDILYMGIKYNKYYCITHLNMKKMIHDIREWPKVKDQDWEAYWRLGKCFTGNLIGMFAYRGQSYAVGRILYTSRVYEDQVYTMETSEDQEMIEIQSLYYSYTDNDNKHRVDVHNLRTFFGCINDSVNNVKDKQTLKRSVIEEYIPGDDHYWMNDVVDDDDNDIGEEVVNIFGTIGVTSDAIYETLTQTAIIFTVILFVLVVIRVWLRHTLRCPPPTIDMKTK
ncbi:uncharacterized protein LOC128951718 [Oppia nitens]|uniref:uncharacterized protein LOC128951718 n=1 Tax=Oppia nitens TaxID=1686743 RepID=UPI0023DB3A1C|nr:uncharacterized protein LOC128951718 [Oppia nitens]